MWSYHRRNLGDVRTLSFLFSEDKLLLVERTLLVENKDIATVLVDGVGGTQTRHYGSNG